MIFTFEIKLISKGTYIKIDILENINKLFKG